MSEQYLPFPERKCSCGKVSYKDLTQGKGDARHWYFICCQDHVYKGRRYNKKQWHDYINFE